MGQIANGNAANAIKYAKEIQKVGLCGRPKPNTLDRFPLLSVSICVHPWLTFLAVPFSGTSAPPALLLQLLTDGRDLCRAQVFRLRCAHRLDFPGIQHLQPLGRCRAIHLPARQC